MTNKEFVANALNEIAFLDRIIDYANAIHSLPESAAVEDDSFDQAGTFGAQWNQPSCKCGLYPYQHGGCPGPAAKNLPQGWKSGDDPKKEGR